jgi:hypothetical protein
LLIFHFRFLSVSSALTPLHFPLSAFRLAFSQMLMPPYFDATFTGFFADTAAVDYAMFFAAVATPADAISPGQFRRYYFRHISLRH